MRYGKIEDIQNLIKKRAHPTHLCLSFLNAQSNIRNNAITFPSYSSTLDSTNNKFLPFTLVLLLQK